MWREVSKKKKSIKLSIYILNFVLHGLTFDRILLMLFEIILEDQKELIFLPFLRLLFYLTLVDQRTFDFINCLLTTIIVIVFFFGFNAIKQNKNTVTFYINILLYPLFRLHG